MQQALNLRLLALILFQSMHPIKDATHDKSPIGLLYPISIHAPYKGCNVFTKSLSSYVMLFQSMHPIKDATLINVLFLAKRWDFNPCTL